MATKFKKGSKEAKAHMAKIRAMRGTGAGKHTDTKSHNVNVKVVSGTKKKNANRQTGTSVKSKDKLRSALPPGKRITGKGKLKHTYTERRANRSDKPGSLTGIDNIAEYERIARLIEYTNKTIGELKIKLSEYNKKPKGAMRDSDIRLTKAAILRYKQNLKIYKTVLTQIKKLL